MYVYVRKDGCAGESTVNNRMLQMRGEERRGEESRETRHSQAVRLQLSGQGHVDEPSTHEGCLAALAYCSRNEAKYVTTSERTSRHRRGQRSETPKEFVHLPMQHRSQSTVEESVALPARGSFLLLLANSSSDGEEQFPGESP
ncbi:hypothetical protein BHM03_00000040 [Ensete ventricosum]|uniref:Uncharacterized protein n=1 Tax=Ensete ventricosum TaxID=4639 RepID=A0A445M8A8_ENSVE|nr:hypothetical protein BHM03_00000040 [Ensete ventricosum]